MTLERRASLLPLLEATPTGAEGQRFCLHGFSEWGQELVTRMCQKRLRHFSDEAQALRFEKPSRLRRLLRP